MIPDELKVENLPEQPPHHPNWECPHCEALVDTEEWRRDDGRLPEECPACGSPRWPEEGKPK